MKVLIAFLAVLSAQALGETVLYCGSQGAEGSFLKVQPERNTMCISGGPWGSNYCALASKTFVISETRVGSLEIDGAKYTFREFVGKSGTEVQLVRVFDVASNPSAADFSIHRVDLAGPYTLVSSAKPNAEAKDGDPTCIQGENSSF